MLRDFHRNWAVVVVALNLGVGLWGLGWARRRRAVPRAFWPLVGAGHLALLAQVVAGVVLLQSFGRTPAVHVFYGFVVLFAAGLSYTARGQPPRKAMTWVSAVALFIGAVSIRGMITAP